MKKLNDVIKLLVCSLLIIIITHLLLQVYPGIDVFNLVDIGGYNILLIIGYLFLIFAIILAVIELFKDIIHFFKH